MPDQPLTKEARDVECGVFMQKVHQVGRFCTRIKLLSHATIFGSVVCQ